MKNITSFFKKYLIKILDDNRRSPVPQPVEYFSNEFDKNIIGAHSQTFVTEKMYTLEIPASALERLYDIERTFYNNVGDNGSRRIFELWMAQQTEERLLRNQYPAVEQAYQHYSTMLHLVTNQQLTKIKID